MRNTFVNKVDAERRILRLVNSYTKGACQLSGLSWVAIGSWARQNGFLDSSELVERLRLLSDLCQRLSDRSHETFQPIDEVLLSGIEQGVDSLDLSLKTIFSK